MATPFADPRTGQLYFPPRGGAARGVRQQGAGQGDATTKDSAVAKAAFARENGRFEERLADARRRMAEGSLVPTPAALVRRWCEGGTGADGGLTGAQRLVMTFMELDAAAGARVSRAPVSTGGRYGSEPRVRTIHRELHRIDFSCIEWARIAQGVAAISWADVVAA